MIFTHQSEKRRRVCLFLICFPYPVRCILEMNRFFLVFSKFLWWMIHIIRSSKFGFCVVVFNESSYIFLNIMRLYRKLRRVTLLCCPVSFPSFQCVLRFVMWFFPLRPLSKHWDWPRTFTCYIVSNYLPVLCIQLIY